jgi:hypothetical protein
MSSFRSDLEAYVATCDHHIAQGSASIARQRFTIEYLPKQGRTTHLAEHVLLCILDTRNHR